MNIKEIEAQAKFLAPVIKAAVDAAIAQFKKDLVAGDGLPEGPMGPQGAAGKDSDPSEVKDLVIAELREELEGIKEWVATHLTSLPSTEEVKSAVLESIHIPQPRDGQDGADGRDAAALEIMPGIDESKSYQRGSYATHNGGLWRAYERTQGMRGWECIVDGVSEVAVGQISERDFTITSVTSSGKKTEKSIHVPSVMYREVYNSGMAYAKGDAVTFNGSLFIAVDDAPEATPGSGSPEDTGWRLAVKQGRNGRDLRENASKHDPSKGVKS